VSGPKDIARKDIDARFGDARVGSSVQACCRVRAEIESVTFLSDHLDGSGKKLLKRASDEFLLINRSRKPPPPKVEGYNSQLGDNLIELKKPEWDSARGGDADVHPISQTRGTHVKILVKVRFSIRPARPVKLVDIRGTASSLLDFSAAPNQTVRDGEIVPLTLTSKDPLPDHVDRIECRLAWFLNTEPGGFVPFANTGPHVLYVTLGIPGGSMQCPTDNVFKEIGPTQNITEARLDYAVRAAKGKGRPAAPSRDKECTDAIFMQMLADEIGYDLGKRFENGPVNNTGVGPKPTLHHYLWLCVLGKTSYVTGECHNIGAAFVLACRILGVQGDFEVGYMYPWSRRSAVPPDFAPAPPPIFLGKYNERCYRQHQVQASAGASSADYHPLMWEHLVFLDGAFRPNNFEGVAKFAFTNTGASGTHLALYAIGDAIFDRFDDAHGNAGDYFAERADTDASGHATAVNRTRGGFHLRFVGHWGMWEPDCRKPYPFTPSNVSTFRWDD